MARETQTEKEAREGGEREARAGDEYYRMMQKQKGRKADRKTRKTRR